MTQLRCACYARFSTDKQNDSSITDQRRKCVEFAERQGWIVLENHFYADEAMSGVGMDRPALNRMLEAAFSSSRPFDAVLVDDTSRLSRNLADAVRIFERLNFAGIRVVAVSQGIDSRSEQADVLMAVHGLVDSLYVKELAKKTHRALEGLALRGMHTGGNCFGYRRVPGSDGVRLEVNESEAAIVRRIFEMSASGLSLKTIAKTINSEGIQPPRPGARKKYGSWCPTAIQAMLRRELYIGRVVWNRSLWVKEPGTNKRLRRPRPQSEWRILERPELRIISNELWQRVRERLAWVKKVYGTQHREGLLHRAALSPYLLTGFLKCGECGANLTIVSGRSGKRHQRYGCPQNFYRGTCENDLRERRDWLEERLLHELQQAVLRPEAVEYAVMEFERQLKAALAKLSDDLGRMRQRKESLEAELRRLTAAVAESGHSTFLLEAIAERERELREITERLLSNGPGSVEEQVRDIRQFVSERLADLQSLLYADVATAKAELAKHVTEIRMMPQQAAGERYYVAEGNWDLLGGYPETGRARHLVGVRARMVAGGGFEPPTFGL